MTKQPFPGSHPPTPREIQAANRRLLGAMKRHKDAKKRFALAEKDLREARTVVKRLIDLLARGGPPSAPAGSTCPTCGHPIGTNVLCVECQGHDLATKAGPF